MDLCNFSDTYGHAATGANLLYIFLYIPKGAWWHSG